MGCSTQTLSNHTASLGTGQRAHGIAEFLKQQWHAYWERRARRVTVLMLQALDDHTLRDIGLGRSEIESVVHGRPGERVRAYDRGWE